MALTHLTFDRSSHHGSLLNSALRGFENNFENLNGLLAAMAVMIDGDGSQAAHFAYMTARFGFQSDAHSKSAWEELNSFLGKLNTDGSVSSVNAAMLQAFAIFR